MRHLLISYMRVKLPTDEELTQTIHNMREALRRLTIPPETTGTKRAMRMYIVCLLELQLRRTSGPVDVDSLEIDAEVGDRN